MTSPSSSRPTIYTIGHSNHNEETFLDLLSQHGIEVLVDVRSQPFSRYNPQFNDSNLVSALKAAGIRYLFMGDQLGGRPQGEEFLDESGRALYYRMAESSDFLVGIERLERGIEEHRVAIMCSEENPAICHRHLLVTRVISGRGVDVLHIRGDGRLETEDQIAPQEKQGVLFRDLEEQSWKSLRSVSPKHLPPNFLES
ncbi:MAG: DUF488 domain-containing protein [Planctomycetes bacterium]|nr:DUF488 domain-containing protein [Planctomycetota bacterium]